MNEVQPIPEFVKVRSQLADRPYELVLAVSNSGEQIHALGHQVVDFTEAKFGHAPLDFVSILYHGTVVGHAAVAARRERGHLDDGHMQVRLNPEHEPVVIGQPSGAQLVLVDNSLKTGETVRRTMQVLEAHDMVPTMFIKPVDYEDQAEIRAQALLAELGLRTFSLYRASQLRHSRYASATDYWSSGLARISLFAKRVIGSSSPTRVL